MHAALHLRTVLLALILAGPWATANGDTIDRVSFKVGGTVIVWTGSGQSPPIARQFIVRTETGERNLIGGSDGIVLAGSLVPAETPEPIATRGTETSFYVASNTAFSIDAKALPMSQGTDLSGISFEFSVTPAGQASQVPHGAGPGLAPGISTLADLATPTTIYRGDRRTAARSGTIAEQSVRFDANWHAVETAEAATADVAFTVFFP